MNRREQLAAARRREEPPEEVKQARPVKSLRPVRMSVDLEPDVYDALVRFTVGVAFDRGMPPIHRVKVFRALLEELSVDEELKGRIADRLEDMK